MMQDPRVPDRLPGLKGGTPWITWLERMVVLAGRVLAALWTAVSSLTLALGRGLRHGDWSAFRRRRIPDGGDERTDAATDSGQ